MNIREKYEEYGLYDIVKVIEEFDKIFGISFPELTAELYNKNIIISQDEVVNYCITNFTNLYESKFHKSIDNNIINTRLEDYNVYYKKMNIYKDKIIKLLDIIMYLYYNDTNTNEEKENQLKELDINHYKNIIVGRDLVRILETLKYALENYRNNVKIINNLETYNTKKHDSFYYTSRHAYPNESLINDEEYYDRTSIARTKKMKKNK